MITNNVFQKQSFAVKILKAHLKKKRLAHTYLFTGNEKWGGKDLALAFAKSLNCQKENYFTDCDCNSCHKTGEYNHPDVHWVGQDEKVKSIKIEEVRNILGVTSLKPYEGKWKIFIFIDANRLTPDASNALLKTLEEPPAHTLFVLLVESKFHLLETIQSRSFEIRLKPASSSDFDIEPAQGSPFLHHQTWKDYFDGYQKYSREEMKDMFDGLMNYLRDVIYRNANKEENSAKISQTLDALEKILETKQAVDENANQKLALSRLSMQLRRLIPPAEMLK